MKRDYYSLLKARKRAFFYIKNFALYNVPDSLYAKWNFRQFARLTAGQRERAKTRAEYYCNLPANSCVGGGSMIVDDFKYPFGEPHKFSAYFFDLYESLRCFAPDRRFSRLFGDIDYETAEPTFVKTRPITGRESLSVLSKLDETRHFLFVKDKVRFEDKKDMIVMRNVVNRQPWRTKLLNLYHDNPRCNVGQINPNVEHPEYVRAFMPMAEQLQYKFICCIEGHDVATNLKWVMSSNSLAVMPRPRIESWFMEGKLIGGVHYVEVKEDYSDLIERMDYYTSHPEEAEQIIKNAHKWVEQFTDERLERCVALLTAERFFRQTGQM